MQNVRTAVNLLRLLKPNSVFFIWR